MPKGRILIVEDEPSIREILSYNLAREGFDVRVESDGSRVPELLRQDRPELMILDLMLPGLDGFEILRLIRREATTADLPVLILSAREEEVDRIVGLELGADDYVTKPFSPREVVLRVKALLRRGEGPKARTDLALGPLRLDVEAHRVFVDGDEVTLTATEFRLLHNLMQRRGRVQSRARLLRDVWGYADDADSRTVDTHVRRLRRKLETAGDLIETVIGVGYRLRD